MDKRILIAAIEKLDTIAGVLENQNTSNEEMKDAIYNIDSAAMLIRRVTRSV